MRTRHKIIWRIIRPLVIVFLWLKFGYTFKKAKKLPGNYIVLSNHATDFDPLMVAASFPREIYFVASEHIARWKRAFKWIDYAFAPIMRYKGTVAASTAVEILRRVRKGANVAIFAEGARTWDGVTGPILPSTAKLIKSARCGLVTYKIVGGHFVSPMWSGANTRRGHCRGEVVNIYTKEQVAAMSQAELYDVITRDLAEDAYARQATERYPYRGKRLAEGLENLLCICPSCGGYDTLVSKEDCVSCGQCDFSMQYTVYGELEGAPFSTVKAFSDWQSERIARDASQGVVYRAENGVLVTVSRHVETSVASGEVSIDGEWLRCGDFAISLATISDMAMHGKHALVFSASDKYFELTISRGSNALKLYRYYQMIAQNTATVSV